MRILIAITALAIAAPTPAATPQWPDKAVSLRVQDESLRDFLNDFAALADVRILVSDAVEGRISGRFDDKPAVVFRDIVKAYGLLPYYDGAVIHLSMASEIQSKAIKVRPAQVDRVLESLVARDLVDRHQSVSIDRESGVINVRGAPEFVLDAEKLARRFRPKPSRAAPVSAPATTPQAAPEELVFRTFRLKYASAADVTFYQNERDVTIPGVVTLLRSMLGDGRSAPQPEVSFNRPDDATVPKLRGKGLSRHSTQASYPSPESSKTQAASDSAPSVASGGGGKVRIVAEPNLNAVIVRDLPSAMPLYANLISELDQEPQLVEIQVTIIDIDKNKLLDIGVDWRFDSADTNARFGGGTIEDQNGGLILNTVLGDSRRFFARVNALAEDGSANITSRPQVLTLSNLEAVLANDESFFVRIAGNEEVDLFNVSVGTSLRVLPNIVGEDGDPQIRLLVTIEDGSIDPNESVDGIPIIERSSLNTQAIIFDGESLLLGGLVRDSASVVTTRVPLLGSVPGLGKLFQRKTNVEATTERLFLISPRLVEPNRSPASRRDSSTKLYLTDAALNPDRATARDAGDHLEDQHDYVEGF